MGCLCTKDLPEVEFNARPVKKLTHYTLDDLDILPGIFVQRNLQCFFQIYKISNNVIGGGAFGEIKLCTHRKTAQTRAVKIIEKAGLPKHLIRSNSLLSEIEIYRELDHPNILKLYEFFEEANKYYVVMEYCEGGDLYEKLTNEKQFSEQKAAEVFCQILSGVIYIHSKKIIHRDLKIENILVEENNEKTMVKIIDFDTATFLNVKTRITGTYGTFHYMAPEVITGSYDEKCDLWSLGVILFLMLAGYHPFFGETSEEVIAQVTKDEPYFAEIVWNEISCQARDLVGKLLEKDPQRRISAGDAFNHPWVVGNKPVSSLETISEDVFHIKKFRSLSKLLQAIIMLIVSQVLPNELLMEYKAIFSAVDRNGDGVICSSELQGLVRDEDLECLGEGVIGYSEFLISVMSSQHLITEDNIKQVFLILDKQGQGKISLGVIKEWLLESQQLGDVLFEEAKEQIGIWPDSDIEIDEFEKLLHELMNG